MTTKPHLRARTRRAIETREHIQVVFDPRGGFGPLEAASDDERPLGRLGDSSPRRSRSSPASAAFTPTPADFGRQSSTFAVLWDQQGGARERIADRDWKRSTPSPDGVSPGPHTAALAVAEQIDSGLCRFRTVSQSLQFLDAVGACPDYQQADLDELVVVRGPRHGVASYSRFGHLAQLGPVEPAGRRPALSLRDRARRLSPCDTHLFTPSSLPVESRLARVVDA